MYETHRQRKYSLDETESDGDVLLSLDSVVAVDPVAQEPAERTSKNVEESVGRCVCDARC